jgi:hypothetical protein
VAPAVCVASAFTSAATTAKPRPASPARREVLEFLASMSSGSETGRRLYERVPGGDLRVALRLGGGTAVVVPIEDISRGGSSAIANMRRIAAAAVVEPVTTPTLCISPCLRIG